MVDSKRDKLIEKYLEKRKKRTKRDDLLKQIAEIDGASPHFQLIKPKIKKHRKKKEESAFEDKLFDSEEDSKAVSNNLEYHCAEENNMPSEINVPENTLMQSASVIETIPEKKEYNSLRSQKFNLQRMQNRDPSIQAARMKLDIFYEESTIISAVKNNPIIFIQGNTGCGKTTQIPQFLLDHGFQAHGTICITQPRRLSAISISARINEELNENLCGYKIKYENTLRPETKIKIVTEGVLLREIATDFMLTKYSVVILDEVHERSSNIDILMGLLGKIVRARLETTNPLRLILMSATLNTALFSRLFPSAPLIELKSNGFKISVCYENRTPEKCLEAIRDKIIAIISAAKGGRKKKSRQHLDIPPQLVNDGSASILVFLPSKEDIYKLKSLLENIPEIIALPLHSQLPRSFQDAVYRHHDLRKVILSTNIAETSITIPDVVFVIDSGLAKYCITDGNCIKYRIGFISKSSAQQRMGRAGRVGPGICFRMYSSARYEQFPENSPSEIELIPMDSTVLYLKSLGIKNVLAFPFPTPVDQISIQDALKSLQEIRALDSQGNVTEKGMLLSKYPLRPQIANILFISHNIDVQAELHIIASILSVGLEIRRNEHTNEYYSNAQSDLIVALRICTSYFREERKDRFSRKMCLPRVALDEILKLSIYLLRITGTENNLRTVYLTQEKESHLCRILFRGFSSHLAINSGSSYIHKNGEVFLLSDSVEAKNNNFVFSHIICGRNREYAKNITVIDPHWLK